MNTLQCLLVIEKEFIAVERIHPYAKKEMFWCGNKQQKIVTLDDISKDLNLYPCSPILYKWKTSLNEFVYI